MLFGPVSTHLRFAPVGKHFGDLTKFATHPSGEILPELSYLDLSNCTSAAQESEILWFVHVHVEFDLECFNISFLEGFVSILDQGSSGWHGGRGIILSRAL